MDLFISLAPEWVLLIGACVVLIAGLSRGPGRLDFVAPLTLVVVLLALGAGLMLGSSRTGSPLPGLWLNSLTYYARTLGLALGTLIVLINWHQPVARERGEYMALILLSLLGILLTASANDWIVLFLALELVSVPTYVLIALSRDDIRAAEASVKYFFLGALSAALLGYGFSFLYGETGTTTILIESGGVIASALPAGVNLTGLGMIGFLLVVAGLAFKIAAIPLHVYAPDVYEGAASPITGLLGFVPKLAGFVALVKLLAAINWQLPDAVFWVVWLVAVGTMTLGNVLALLQTNVKRMLGYSSIAHTGYMLIALLVGPVAGEGPMRDALAAMFFYLVVYGAMNLGAFALLAAFRRADRDVETLDDLAGLSRRARVASLAMAVCVFSLMGLPPTAGFFGKLYIFASAFSVSAANPFHQPLVMLAIIGVINSAIAAAYYLRIVSVMYVRQPIDETTPAGGAAVRCGLVLCALLMLILFAWPNGLAGQAQQAGASMRQQIGSTGEKVAHVEAFPLNSPHPSAMADEQAPQSGNSN